MLWESFFLTIKYCHSKKSLPKPYDKNLGGARFDGASISLLINWSFDRREQVLL